MTTKAASLSHHRLTGLFRRLANHIASSRAPVTDFMRLQGHDPYRVLVCTVLSARTRDQVTLKVADELLHLAPDPQALRALESDRLREFFTPSADWSQVIAAEMQSVREGAECVVGVHIRLSDYRHHDGGRLFVPVDMHRRMMQELETQMAPCRVRFLICSDEALDKTVFKGLDICFGNGHPLVDLYMLAACDRIMGPPSTYSQWASFYGKTPRRTYWNGMSNHVSHAQKTEFIIHAKGFGRYI